MAILKQESYKSAQTLQKSQQFHNFLPLNVRIFLKIFLKNSFDHFRWDIFLYLAKWRIFLPKKSLLPREI